jgi:hypothetical protein
MRLLFLRLQRLSSYQTFCHFATKQRLQNSSGIHAATWQQKLAADLSCQLLMPEQLQITL